MVAYTAKSATADRDEYCNFSPTSKVSAKLDKYGKGYDAGLAQVQARNDQILGRRPRRSEVAVNVHALMKDAHNIYGVVADQPIEEHM